LTSSIIHLDKSPGAFINLILFPADFPKNLVVFLW